MTERAGQLELPLAGAVPDYTVRRSRRARYLSVSVTPQHGVLVTLPTRVARSAVEPFLARHRVWLESELQRLDEHPSARERGRLPAHIELPALDRSLQVEYRRTAAVVVRVHERDDMLQVRGAAADKPAVCAALQRWLARSARPALTSRLAQLSAEHALPFRRCAIRGQRTRWGSGSTTGDISLNYKLLFLRPALVDYVLLHELAHTRHADHSPRFWRCLESLLPGCRELHQELRHAPALVPWWAEA